MKIQEYLRATIMAMGPQTSSFTEGRAFTHSRNYLADYYAMEKLGFENADDIKPLFKTLEGLGFRVQQL